MWSKYFQIFIAGKKYNLCFTHFTLKWQDNTHTHSLLFPPISLKSRMHACSFVCCKGLKNVADTGKNIFIQTFTELCEGKDTTPKHLAH